MESELARLREIRGENLISNLENSIRLQETHVLSVSKSLAELKLALQPNMPSLIKTLRGPVSQFNKALREEFRLKKELWTKKPRIMESDWASIEAGISSRISDLERENTEWLEILRNYRGELIEELAEESQRLYSAIDVLRDVQTFVRTRVPVRPDSERLGTILPEKCLFDGQRLHFVNRDDSTRELLKTLHRNFLKRFERGGPADMIALLDSVYGMGKTTFSLKFLALVARYWENNSVNMEYQGLFSEEIFGARTLHITMTPRMVKDMEKSFVEELMKQVEYQWGYRGHVPELNSFQGAIEFITHLSPVFLVFDEIGSAFQTSPDVSNRYARDEFLSFIREYCVPLLRMNRVYFLLCGRAEFLSHVGYRPGDVNLSVSPVKLERVNLNPIREVYIADILQNTICLGDRQENTSFVDIIRSEQHDFDIEIYCTHLYTLTGGHPRSLLKVLTHDRMLEHPENIDMMFELLEVQDTIRLYRQPVRELYDGFANKTKFNLLSLIQGGRQPKRPTMEYIATRIYAGFGSNKNDTEIFIPPPVLRVLGSVFMPFYDFVIRYTDSKMLIDKSRIFEELLLKWFQTVFSQPGGATWGSLCAPFIPEESILHKVVAQLDHESRIDGKRVVPSKKAKSNGISIQEMSTKLTEYLHLRYPHIYFPAPQSSSPDIFILPPIRDGDIIIGVAAKCWSSGRLSESMILQELRKFQNICEANDYLGKQSRVLIICTTAPLSGEADPSTSRVLQSNSVDGRTEEVMVMNLTNDASIERFCSLGVSTAEEAKILTRGIRDLIEYVQSRGEGTNLVHTSDSE